MYYVARLPIDFQRASARSNDPESLFHYFPVVSYIERLNEGTCFVLQ